MPATIRSMVKGKALTSLTCYDYSTARLLNATALDCLLVGDSLAMTVLGHPDTLSVTVDEMLHHVGAVTRGAPDKLVIADMPFMSYHLTVEDTLTNAARFIQVGRAQAVKLEGAAELTLASIRRLVAVGIPVMGHIGLTPQAIHTLGGFRVQGKTPEAIQRLRAEIHALEVAGVFAVVLECIPLEVSRELTVACRVPTLGIGAGPHCDGQILVIDDLLGRYQAIMPRFVRRFLDMGTLTADAVQQYIEAVRAGSFPDPESESFHLSVESKVAN